MLPTVRPDSRAVYLRTDLFGLARRVIGSAIRRGQVVIVRRPDRGGLVLKRVVGLPGEDISIVEGIVFINGEALSEPYAYHPNASLRLADHWPKGSSRVAVPAGAVFVLGDNRSQSVDSRAWGAVLLSDLVGLFIVAIP
jgi:signal peptidase I